MKKYCFTAIFIFALIFQAYAQTRPFIGYDQVAFGASVDVVRNAYNLGDDIALQVDSDDPNIATLTQRNVSESIRARTFYFNRWRTGNYQLYRVAVWFEDNSDNNLRNITGVFENRYGRATDFNNNYQEYFTDRTTIYGRFAPDIEVQLLHRKQNDNAVYSNILVLPLALALMGMEVSDLNFIRVLYTWKGFRDEYQASRLGL